ncbi:MAG: hypothetical protein ACTSRP_01515 [Candidatus Helarchaeota archaeon]
MRLLITLGDFNDDLGRGKIVEIDLEEELAFEKINFLPPKHLRVPTKGFTGADWISEKDKRELLVCGFSAIYKFDTKNWVLKGIYHQPCMNDLHHVEVTKDKIYVSNTGYDRIDIFDKKFNFIGGYYLEPSWVSNKRYNGINPSYNSWKASFSLDPSGIVSKLVDEGEPKGYYFNSNKENLPFHQKKLKDFVHPNHICLLKNHIILTRFADRSIQDLLNWDIVISKTPGYPHDGKKFDDLFWITCTNGFIVGYEIYENSPIEKIIECLNVFKLTNHTGWLRGLFITEDLFIVGLTKISRMPRYRWCDLPFKNTESSIIAIDRYSNKLLYHIDLSGFGSHPKIFEILGF